MPSSAGVSSRTIFSQYVARNALLPQVTGLALSLGHVFGGAVIVEFLFNYPGMGRLLIAGIYAGDYSLVLGVTTISIIAVAVGGVRDRHPLPADRSARETGIGRCSRFFATCCATTASSSSASILTGHPRAGRRAALLRALRRQCHLSSSPPDMPPSAEYWLGTTSRGQDVFWQISAAIWNTLLFGIVVAVISRIIAITVGPGLRAISAGAPTRC